MEELNRMMNGMRLIEWARYQLKHARERGRRDEEVVASAYIRGGIDALHDETDRIAQEGKDGAEPRKPE